MDDAAPLQSQANVGHGALNCKSARIVEVVKHSPGRWEKWELTLITYKAKYKHNARADANKSVP